MTYYAALDVSLRSVAICINDDQGAVCLERIVPSEINDIVACLKSEFPARAAKTGGAVVSSDFDYRVGNMGELAF